MKELFRLLGFKLAETEAKYTPFARAFDPLGVRVDLSQSAAGVVKIEPKPSRVENVLAEAAGILGNGKMKGYEASGLGQRIRFLRDAHLGKCGARVLNELAEHSKAAGSEAEIKPRLKKGLEWLLSYLPSAPARQIKAWSDDSPVLIFTDGANEPEAVTIGAVLLERGGPQRSSGKECWARW